MVHANNSIGVADCRNNIFLWIVAVKFIWNCCVESLEQLKTEEGSGCILAHCMGLGKTLSVCKFNYFVVTRVELVRPHGML